MSNRVWPFIGLIFLAAASGAQENRKAPPPPAADQSKAEKTIRGIFKDDFAKRAPSDKVNLAKTLMAQAAQTQDDPATQFVLLREARELAIQAQDPFLAMTAIDEMASRFTISAFEMKCSALSAVLKAARATLEFRLVLEASLKTADAAAFADDYEAASEILSLAEKAARRMQEAPFLIRVARKAKRVADFKQKFEKVKKVKEGLVANPGDPALNLTMGQFQCFVKGNWEGGLPCLQKGSDDILRKLAEADLKDPSDLKQQVEAGDGWWDFAEKDKSASNEMIRDRAAFWYAKAIGKLSGAERVRIEKRLQEAGAPKLARGTWVDVTDPRLFNLPGKAKDPVKVRTEKGFYKGVKAQSFPKGDYDGISVHVQFDPVEGISAFVIFDPAPLAAYVNSENGLFRVAHMEKTEKQNNWVADYTVNWTAQNENTITVLIVDGEYVVYLNGREMTCLKTNEVRLSRLELEAWDGVVQFDRIRLRKTE